jgi:uncharacterized protein (TIGR03118 family)
MSTRLRCRLATAAVVSAFGAVAAFAATGSAAQPNAYVVTNLTSNVPGAAANTDPNLVNAWGLAASSTSPWWVADNGTDLSTLYPPTGAPIPLVVTVPGGPTGAVFNTTASSFFVAGAGASAKAAFLFASEDGKIRGWNPSIPPPTPPTSTQTEVGADRSEVGAIYKGLAINANPDRLYAADFHNARVDVFDGGFNLISAPGAFTDPELPAGYAPFGIQNIAGTIFVTYAKQDAEQEDEVAGQGLGIVDAYDLSGTFEGRVATRGQLNAPWGVAEAPDDFGRFSGDLLIGNFGDGEITAFARDADGEWGPRGQLRSSDGKRIAIDGLWALEFGHGAANNGPTNTLFFTAGPNDEQDGLFGSITAG